MCGLCKCDVTEAIAKVIIVASAAIAETIIIIRGIAATLGTAPASVVVVITHNCISFPRLFISLTLQYVLCRC